MPEVVSTLRQMAAVQPHRLVRHGASVADALAGVALAAWWSAIAPWRSAVVGAATLPAEEALVALAMAVAACAMPRVGARSIAVVAFAGALSVAVVAGWLAAAGPNTATSFVYGAVVLGLPLAAVVAASVARFDDDPVASAAATARCALGAALGAWSVSLAGAEGAPWSVVAGIAAMLAAASCGAMLLPLANAGAAQGESRSHAAPLRCGAMAGALLAWMIATPFGIGASPAEWPLVASGPLAWAAAAIGAACAAKWGQSLSGGQQALAVAATAVAAAFAAEGSAAAASISVALAVSLLAVCACSGLRAAAALGVVLGGAAFVLASLFGATAAATIGILAALAGLGVARRGAAGWFAAAVGVAVAVSGSIGEHPAASDPLAERLLAAHGAARVVWRPSTQESVLSVAGRESDRSGPTHRHAALAAAVVVLLAERGPVAVVDDGIGVFAALARECGIEPLWRSSPSADVAEVAAAARVDGPARPRSSESGLVGNAIASVGTRAFVLHATPGTCVAVVDASLLGIASAARATAEERFAAASAAGGGATVACWSLSTSPPAVVDAAVRATAAAHGWCGVFLSDASAVVVGLARAPDWLRAEERWRGLPVEARWRLHAAGIGGALDLRDALAVVVAAPTRCPRDDEALLACLLAGSEGSHVDANVRLLRDWVGADADPVVVARLAARSSDVDEWARADATLAAAVAAAPECVLLRGELIRLRVRRADQQILSAPRDASTRVAEAAALAARFVPFGCPSAPLQAALALPDRKGEKLRDRRAAAAAAFALDPGFYDTASPLLRDVLEGSERSTPAADFARFPQGARLAELAAQDGPLAILLRTRHASRAADALVEQWGRRELSSGALAVLRELADPFVLRAAADALSSRGGKRELVRIWRADLPATAAIRELFDGPAEQRQALMVAIAGRKDSGSLLALGDGLVDIDEGVRVAAGAALFRSIGDGIVYDPTWPQERLREAAARLAQLSQRTSR